MTAVFSVAATGAAAAVLAEAAGAEPWYIAAIVLPLAGFVVWLVKWILQQQAERDKAAAARDEKREAREERRAEQGDLQTEALRECVSELRQLNEQQRELPTRVVDLIEQRQRRAV